MVFSYQLMKKKISCCYQFGDQQKIVSSCHTL